MCFKLLAELILMYRHRFSNTYYIALLNAFIQHQKLNLKWKAIHEV